MVAGGVRLAGRAPYRAPAQSLVAVGIGIVYLSLYAAHALYALVGAPAAFVAMAVVTAVGFATALRLDSRALAVLATLGGLLTPVILNTDTDAAGALFTYLAILDLGVLLVASRQGWPGLALLAFAGTQILYWGWLDRWYQASRLPARPRMGDRVLPRLRGLGPRRVRGRAGDPALSGSGGRWSSSPRRRSTSRPRGASWTTPRAAAWPSLALALAGLYLVAARVAARSAGRPAGWPGSTARSRSPSWRWRPRSPLAGTTS